MSLLNTEAYYLRRKCRPCVKRYEAVALKGRPKIPKRQIRCVLGLLFRAFPISRTFIPSPFSPHSLLPSTSPQSHFTPRVPFPEEVNKKFSYRGQNELSIIKTHERNTVSEHILFLSMRQYRLAGERHSVFDLSVRLSVRPFVHSFVCYKRRDVTLRKRTDFNANWHRSSAGART